MKKIAGRALTFMLLTLLFISMWSTEANAQNKFGVSISYQNFYDELSPYGTWIDYPAYGHVWHPAIAGEFRPYVTNGYWDYSADGWIWMSNYSWGWAPFHYGRWVYDDAYGWLWIPGYEWSPAWVTWGMVDNFYAWAPLLPEVNVGISFGLWRPASFYWNFVAREHICDRDIFNVMERRDKVTSYSDRINIINNFNTTSVRKQFYSKGPDVDQVQQFANHKIEMASIKEVNSNSIIKRKGNEIQVYRPAVINPQPREFRTPDEANLSPVRNNEDRVKVEREEQRQNIERLPVNKAPGEIFKNLKQFGGSKTRRH